MHRRHKTSSRYLLLTALILVCFPGSPHAAPPTFEAHWRDGRAELNGYRLVVDRYGQPRSGTAVLIYVTEPFSRAQRVKVDHPEPDAGDTVDVLKLNLIRDFQTGIYDYNTMLSTFHGTADGAPLKFSFSSAEWCGHVYEDLRVTDHRVSGHADSYFQNESGALAVPRLRDGVFEDSLWTTLRGLTGPSLADGEERRVPYLPGAFHRRLTHLPLRWTEATIRRGDAPVTVTVPAGEFETIVYEIDTSDGRHGIFHIERHPPHRVIRWQLPPEISAELTGSVRLPYWQLNANGHEKHLTDLGLSPDRRDPPPTDMPSQKDR